MNFILVLLIGIIIGWILQAYLPPELVNTVNKSISQWSSKLSSSIAGLFETKTQGPVSSNTAEKKSGSPNDLKKIEGIGPKIADLLNDDGILTYAHLANAKVGRLNSILEKGGSRYRRADPSTWPKQAAMAKKGDWEGLKKLQNKLKGGRRSN